MVSPFLLRRALLAVTVLLLVPALRPPAAAAPEGALTLGLHVTLATEWLDPSDTEAFVNPFMVLYAVHDALVSKDGLVCEFGPYEDLRLKAPR